MEEERAASSPTGERTPLEVLKEEETSLLSLLRILLSGKTLPHLVLIGVLSALFQVMATAGSETASALGFLSLSGGYLLTGLMVGIGPVGRWIELPEAAGDVAQSRLKGFVSSFRICLFPLAMAAVVLAVLLGLVGQQGVLGDLRTALPLALSSCFVIWAIVQGRGFGRWLSSLAASKLPEGAQREEGGTARFSLIALGVLVALSSVLLVVFEWLTDANTGPAAALLENGLFFVVLGAVFVIAWRRSLPARLQASRRMDFHRFANRWMLLTQLMITWHLLTVWRHWTITPEGPLLFIEEFLLMMFTVIMAIWGLTSKSYRSTLRLVNTHNALPMGLAFGYAYAGSVAMLTTVLEEIDNVMMAGHLIVVLTFLWMQPKVLARTMGGMEAAERIKHVVNSAVPAEPVPGSDDASSDSTPRPEDAVEATAETGSESPDSSEPSAGQTEATDDANDAIGADVSWSEPEVLANDVAWDEDDDIEVLD